jgi:CheY-like chemotaxis protein
VDDNSAVRQTAEAMLAAGDCSCITVADSIAALCAVVEHQPQVVVLDADSGPLQPWQFVRLLQEHPQHQSIRVVYTSTRDDVIERARALAAGIGLFLPKPFTSEELLAAVSGQLSSAA